MWASSLTYRMTVPHVFFLVSLHGRPHRPNICFSFRFRKQTVGQYQLDGLRLWERHCGGRVPDLSGHLNGDSLGEDGRKSTEKGAQRCSSQVAGLGSNHHCLSSERLYRVSCLCMCIYSLSLREDNEVEERSHWMDRFWMKKGSIPVETSGDPRAKDVAKPSAFMRVPKSSRSA